ncbi:MAG: VWA domain-containing protein [Acidobacteriota bacterium]
MSIPHTEPSRLPVYLLLDCSGSMVGDPIVAVNQGTRTLFNELCNNPQAIETAWISVITFGGTAEQLIPLTELTKFQPPDLTANGNTPMGEALRILNDAIEREVRLRQTADHKADYKPLVFILTDGKPTDDNWEARAQALRDRLDRKVADVYAIGCGSMVDRATLEKVTHSENIFMMPDLTPAAIQQLFKWLSQSIQRCSEPKSQGTSPTRKLPPPPPVLQI